MTKILLITCIVGLEISAFGMSWNEANRSGHHQRNTYIIKKDIRRHNKKPIQKQRALNNWTNPVEALISLGMLKTNSPKKPMFSQLSKERNEQHYRRILPAHPEWDKYINWDPEEPTTSGSEATAQVVSKTDSADQPAEKIVQKYNLSAANKFLHKFHNTEVIPLSQLHRACVQSCVNFYKPLADGQSAEERSLARLKKVHEQLTPFTRKTYMEITKASSTTASRDFEYGLERGILKEFGVIHGRKIYKFVREI